MIGRRPFVTTMIRKWRQGETHTPGIAIMRGTLVCAHLTPDEALAFADQLVDLAETLQAQNQDQEVAA